MVDTPCICINHINLCFNTSFRLDQQLKTSTNNSTKTETCAAKRPKKALQKKNVTMASLSLLLALVFVQRRCANKKVQKLRRSEITYKIAHKNPHVPGDSWWFYTWPTFGMGEFRWPTFGMLKNGEFTWPPRIGELLTGKPAGMNHRVYCYIHRTYMDGWYFWVDGIHVGKYTIKKGSLMGGIDFDENPRFIRFFHHVSKTTRWR